MGGMKYLIIIYKKTNFWIYLVTSVSFHNEDSETFIFGCDSGHLYKGSLNSLSSVESRKINYLI
jgi:hypothetical protein